MVKREYWENGRLWREALFSQGQKHGITKYWHSNGQQSSEYPYHHGQLCGIVRWWYKSGTQGYKTYYLYNKIVTPEEYRRHELIVKLSGL